MQFEAYRIPEVLSPGIFGLSIRVLAILEVGRFMADGPRHASGILDG